MLDVHPPHEAAHTWKEFLIHIATIVVGLLIAVGLEQTVEYLHHRHQVAETREALEAEKELNQRIVADDVIKFRREVAALRNNLLVLQTLQAQRGLSRAELPGILTWHSSLQVPMHDAAWTTAKQTSVLNLLPPSEVRRYSLLYDYLDRLTAIANEEYAALGEVRFYAATEPDPTRWSPEQVATAIDKTRSVMAKLYDFGDNLGNMNDDFPEFAANLDSDLASLRSEAESEHAPDLAAPRAKTIERLDAAGKFHDFFPQK